MWVGEEGDINQVSEARGGMRYQRERIRSDRIDLGKERESIRRHRISNEIYLSVEKSWFGNSNKKVEERQAFPGPGFCGKWGINTLRLKGGSIRVFRGEAQSLWRREVKRAPWVVTEGVRLLAMEPEIQRTEREWLRGRVSGGSWGGEWMGRRSTEQCGDEWTEPTGA